MARSSQRGSHQARLPMISIKLGRREPEDGRVEQNSHGESDSKPRDGGVVGAGEGDEDGQLGNTLYSKA
jgi:hypothetical protein